MEEEEEDAQEEDVEAEGTFGADDWDPGVPIYRARKLLKRYAGHG